jgi:hypothetical protein
MPSANYDNPTWAVRGVGFMQTIIPVITEYNDGFGTSECDFSFSTFGLIALLFSNRTRRANSLDHRLSLTRWRRSKAVHDTGNQKVKQHAQGADAFRRNTEPPIFGGRRLRADELKPQDVTCGKADSGEHAADRT